ncbi:MAG: arylesterase [Candidatus Omnitrophota bacterium]
MLRIISISLILFCLCIHGCGPSVRNIDSQGTNIICFGNSITYGSGVEDGQDYPSRLQELTDRDVINAGIPGDTTEGGLKRIDEDVLDNDPYLVIIELGANDYLQGLPKDKAFNNLKKMIERIQDEGAMTALCDVSGGSSFLEAYSIYHEDMKKLAGETGSIFMPHVMKGIIQKPSLKSDNIHPNAEGYEIIAERVYKAIKPHL